MLITTEGAVISSRDEGENGRYIKVLSPDMGIIDIQAKGAKKLGSGNNASTQLFACSRFCVKERSGRYYLNSSEPVKTFYGLRTDIKKLSLASYFAQVITYTVTAGQSARDIYRLFLNCLYMLSEKDAECSLVKFVFEMRLVSELGMIPQLLGCRECYKSDRELNFFIRHGYFLCGEHMDSGDETVKSKIIPLSPGMFEAIRYVCLSEPGRLFSFKLSEKALETLGRISESYLQEQIERHFDTLDFYRSI